MLIELSVANYRSFLDRGTLSLEAEPRLSERDKSVDERNLVRSADSDLLRIAAIYGANASGKSNLIQALAALRRLVLHSARDGQCGDRLPAAPFLFDAASAAEPSEVEVVYLEDGLQIRYGAAFVREKITREWLFTRRAGDDDEVRWFERTDDRYEVGDAWRRDRGSEERTRPEALHLSVAAAWRHPQAAAVLRWFKALRIVDGVDDPELLPRAVELLAEGGVAREALRSVVCNLDLGIDDLRLAGGPGPGFAGLDPHSPWILREAPSVVARLGQQRRIKILRRGVEFELVHESGGAARAIALAGAIVEALVTGGVLIVDDFDAHLHPLLARQLVELFQEPAQGRGAQLVFTGQDTTLLTRTLLRRDQIWFIERSRRTEASDLFSLAELRFEDGKRVRNDARYAEDYLQGRYGAIPFFGNLQAIVGEVLAGGAL